jgi:hypothetical protein
MPSPSRSLGLVGDGNDGHLLALVSWLEERRWGTTT